MRCVFPFLWLVFLGFMGAALHGQVTLLYFNDAHEMDPVDDGARGGMARVAALVEAERERVDHPVWVLFGGDLAGGTLFGLLKGEPIVEMLNHIGVAVATFGQHEFDHGPDQARRNVDLSEFPWITSNLMEVDGSSFHGLPQTVILKGGGMRIGFFGLTTAMETTRAQGEVIQGDTHTAGAKAVEALRSEGVDWIVALTQQTVGEDLALSREIPGIDLILGEEISETVTRLDREGATYFGRSAGNVSSIVRVEIPGSKKEDWRLSVIQVDSRSPEDSHVLERAEYYRGILEEKLGAVVRPLSEPFLLPVAGSRERETSLGRLVAGAFRSALGADAGFVTGGGLRSDLAGLPPGLTLRDAAKVQPFNNPLRLLEVSGADLFSLWEWALSAYPNATNRFPQTDGMIVSFDSEAPPGSRLRQLWIGDRVVLPEGTYTLATSAFLAEGGDGFTMLQNAKTLSVGPLDREALADHLANLEDLAMEWTPALLPLTPHLPPVR